MNTDQSKSLNCSSPNDEPRILLATDNSSAVGSRQSALVYSHRVSSSPLRSACSLRAFFAPRSGDLVARVKPYVYLGGYVGGSGHGSPHDYDRHVPVVFMGPGVRPGPRDAETGPEDIAWALGRLLGLPYPQQDAVTDLLPLLR